MADNDLTPDEQPLQHALRGLAEMLLTDHDPNEVLASVTSLAADGLAGCDAASISLLRKGRPTTPVCSAELARDVDHSQYESRGGPCLHAIDTAKTVRVDSFVTDARWPAFNKAAVAQGVLSSLSLPLQVGEEVLGALNLYSTRDAGFVGEEEHAAVFARQASITLTNSIAVGRAQELAQHLAIALENRDIIGQAKGVLMAAEGLSPDQAFDVLRRASQRSNRKLHDVAREIVERRRPRGSPSRPAYLEGAGRRPPRRDAGPGASWPPW